MDDKNASFTAMAEGLVAAVDVTEEEYMTHYAADFCELVEGIVFKMSPVREIHDQISRYLALLFEAYFAHSTIGRLRQAPFVMKLDNLREPDLQIILNDNPHSLTETAMEGPADICIEIVSPGSTAVDYGQKLIEYEQGGVREYWIIDPERRLCRFHRLEDDGLYHDVQADSEQVYRTPLLPGLALPVLAFWEQPLPNFLQVAQMVETMLGRG